MRKDKLDKKIKAVLLLSGGLDSRLALKMMKAEGIEVVAVNFMTMFCNCTSKGSCKLEAQKAADEDGVEVEIINMSGPFLEVIRKPKHGYGSGMNPCLDCRVLMFSKAKEYMQEIGASFIVTGEVLGERPMSQRMDAMRLIERESGLEGLILRPLSAHYFEPSLPEKEGWVDRTKLLAIKGRSRKPQIQLAEKLGLYDYPCPAGGCLLTDPEFSRKMRDLVKQGEFSGNDVQLLKLGRHFRINKKTKVIVGRNDLENKKIKSLAQADDQLFELDKKPGPLVLLRGKLENGEQEIAAGLTIYYSKSRDLKEEAVKVFDKTGEATVLRFKPIAEARVLGLKI